MESKNKNNIFYFLLMMIITLGGAYLSYKFTGDMSIYSNTITQPKFVPPAIVFKIVWPILYVLMGVASYRILVAYKNGEASKYPLILYFIQLALNLMWPLIFFKLRLVAIAAIELLLLLVIVILMTIEFFKVDKVSGFLVVPYVLWLIFALVLNFALFWVNS